MVNSLLSEKTKNLLEKAGFNDKNITIGNAVDWIYFKTEIWISVVQHNAEQEYYFTVYGLDADKKQLFRTVKEAYEDGIEYAVTNYLL